METILRGNKRSAENDNAVTIEKFLKSKRLRRTLMNEEEGGEEGRDTGQYDEEMVIVLVEKEGEEAMQNDYQQLVDNLNIEEEVAYDFINEHENTVNFINESVSTGIEQQPKVSSQVQQQQIVSANLNPVARRIIGTKSLKVRNELCRLCLSKHNNMCSLFETSLTFIKSSLKDIIETCIGIRVLRDDATDRICRACISRLESIWAFREQCEKSDRMVKQMKRVKYVQSQSGGDRNQNLNLCNNDTFQSSNDEPLEDVDNPRQFFCNDCERKFHTEIALAAHVTNDHAHLKPFTHKTSFLVSCSLCGRKVLKKVLHDHYLQHKLAGEDKNVTANHEEVYEVEEEDEEFVDDVAYYEGGEEEQQNIEENGMEDVAEEEILPNFSDMADTATLDAGQITGLLNKENELAYNQNECFVTDITGNEFINVDGVEGADEDPNVIAVRINEHVQEDGNFGETGAPQYTQVYLVDQGENLVETSQGNDVEHSIPVIQDVVHTGGSTEDNHIYVVASDGKSMYLDNQDVVFQIANDQVYQADSDVKDEIEVVYESEVNMTETVLVKEEVIDPSYD